MSVTVAPKGFLPYGIALTFLSVIWVIAILFLSIMTSVPKFVNVTMSMYLMIYTTVGNMTNCLSEYSYIANWICPCNDQSTCSIHSMKYVDFDCQNPICLEFTNGSYHLEVVDHIWLFGTRSFSSLQLWENCYRVMHHCDYNFTHWRSEFSKSSVL